MYIALGVILLVVFAVFTMGAVVMYPPGSYRKVTYRANTWVDVAGAFGVAVAALIGGVLLIGLGA